MDIGLGAENVGEFLVAYLDLNDDSQFTIFLKIGNLFAFVFFLSTDIITLDENQRSLRIYTWNDDKKKFELY